MNKTKTKIAKNWSIFIHFRCNKIFLIASFFEKIKKIFIASICEIKRYKSHYTRNISPVLSGFINLEFDFNIVKYDRKAFEKHKFTC